MIRRANIRLRTRSRLLTLPVPRPACPVCATLWRIQNSHRDKDQFMKDPPLIRRGGDIGSCGYCSTRYKAVVIEDYPVEFYYIATDLHKMIKDQLANYWTSTHKGPLPDMLKLEVETE